MSVAKKETAVERWGLFELALEGPAEGNPFTEVELQGQFTSGHRSVCAAGFYDGDGLYRIRFMPDEEGQWSYTTQSNCAVLDGQCGGFTCLPPGEDNHGPVRVRNTFHFCYEDGAPYFPVGTTCYVWNHQGDVLEEQTLKTLREGPFNKMRMCVFPKSYDFNQNEPPFYPYAGSREKGWDYTCFNPAFFRHLEARIGDLLALGIEADLILFHPYDRWGYATMDPDSDDRYLRYLVARLAAYRNVWWSFANEFDLMKGKSLPDWDRFFRIVQSGDPVQHLRSIHNCRGFYDHNKPWVTHCSIQRHDLEKAIEWRALYGKPIVVDECGYEGSIDHGWGNLTAREMVRRFWEGFTRGGYVGHGETYVHPEDVLWWSKGGVLHGESPVRIGFLRQLVEAGPAEGLEPQNIGGGLSCAGRRGEYYLAYCGPHQSSFKRLKLPEDGAFAIEVIDTWEMNVIPLQGTFSGACRVELPARPWIALRIRKV